MHDRSNGLGGGFAAYGIYPEYRDFYAFQDVYKRQVLDYLIYNVPLGYADLALN